MATTATTTTTGASVDASSATVPNLLTTEQAAEYLSVSVRTVKQLMSSGRLAYVKIGRATRLDPADLDAFIAQNRQHRKRSARKVS